MTFFLSQNKKIVLAAISILIVSLSFVLLFFGGIEQAKTDVLGTAEKIQESAETVPADFHPAERDAGPAERDADPDERDADLTEVRTIHELFDAR